MKKKSNKKGAIFLKDGEIVDTPRRRYLTWESDRKVWEEKIKNRDSFYTIRRKEIRNKYQPLIEERQRKIREKMNNIHTLFMV